MAKRLSSLQRRDLADILGELELLRTSVRDLAPRIQGILNMQDWSHAPEFDKLINDCVVTAVQLPSEIELAKNIIEDILDFNIVEAIENVI